MLRSLHRHILRLQGTYSEFVSPSDLHVEAGSSLCVAVVGDTDLGGGGWSDLEDGLYLYKRDLQEILHSFFHVGKHQENNFLRSTWEDNGSAGTLALNFSAPKTVRNEFCLFISHPVCGSLLRQLHKLRQSTVNEVVQIHVFLYLRCILIIFASNFPSPTT